MDLIQYNAQAVLAGPANALTFHTPLNITPLYGIQSANFDFSEPLLEVESANGVLERIHNGPNVINLSLGYLLRDGKNEAAMGFITNGSAPFFTNFLADERNYFILVKNDHLDVDNYSGFDCSVMSFTQGCLTSYGIQCQVGQPLMANASFSFLNIGYSLTSSGAQLPIVNKQNGQTMYSFDPADFLFTGSGDEGLASLINNPFSCFFSGSGDSTNVSGDIFSIIFTGDGSDIDWEEFESLFVVPFVNFDTSPIRALGQGDITLNLPSGISVGLTESGSNSLVIQSFDLQAALARQEDRPMNYVFPRNRFIEPPIELRLSVNAYIESYKVNLLNERLCNNSGYAVDITLNQRCNNGSGIMKYHFDGLRLDSTSVTNQVGGFQSVNLSWSSKIYNVLLTGSAYPNLVVATGLSF